MASTSARTSHARWYWPAVARYEPEPQQDLRLIRIELEGQLPLDRGAGHAIIGRKHISLQHIGGRIVGGDVEQTLHDTPGTGEVARMISLLAGECQGADVVGLLTKNRGSQLGGLRVESILLEYARDAFHREDARLSPGRHRLDQIVGRDVVDVGGNLRGQQGGRCLEVRVQRQRFEQFGARIRGNRARDAVLRPQVRTAQIGEQCIKLAGLAALHLVDLIVAQLQPEGIRHGNCHVAGGVEHVLGIADQRILEQNGLSSGIPECQAPTERWDQGD